MLQTQAQFKPQPQQKKLAATSFLNLRGVDEVAKTQKYYKEESYEARLRGILKADELEPRGNKTQRAKYGEYPGTKSVNHLLQQQS
jgi:hypothetical protein